MDSYWESQTMAIDDHDQIPQTKLPVTILGKKYSALYDRDDIRKDIISRIWCTYRRNFAPIGGSSGFTSDSGWGCMHRCGQMMLAQTLIMVHLGRDWRWESGTTNEQYKKIVQYFHDTKKSVYSIQMISSFGQAEGKAIGKWFGPNTVAQVLKKLTKEDKWTNLVIHVTMEDGIIIDEIMSQCRKLPKSNSKGKKMDIIPETETEASDKKDLDVNQIRSSEIDDNCVEILTPPINRSTNQKSQNNQHIFKTPSVSSSSTSSNHNNIDGLWKPLLLIIPVRLGLNELNPCYIPALKEVFQLPQCVGILGGRPSHALWFIGTVGDDLISLDPHESQLTPQLLSQEEMDATFHCERWNLMHITKLDPSLAIGFVVKSQDDLLDLCERLQKQVLEPAGDHPLFEIHQKRPYYFPPLETLTIGGFNSDSISGIHNTEDEFELL